ncbi:vWA domain-containing protein [Tropicibacter naphthalenivorans]|uniref:Mg-chelatase subunit ChlD n=1 Tax=Tropicibacter naphthalenivorans TaxID=441103 RepID=A0A0P1G9D3_9RHOB|nr:VWA domain-containing protein [Tropicibacter naphthalenivorans]CUH78168.1 Mg-chelatase subunit ChlD [Tropicibacter naphthalenivorans]SMC93257.1 Ca-activated chloride channel family protein [Tropicibacter naphthalenivorans]
MLRAALITLLTLSPAHASDSCTEDAMIVFDGSGSMAETGYNNIGGPRITDARAALHKVVPSIADARRLGLILYGPGPEESCENIDLRFPPQWSAAPRILSDVDTLEPSGETPLTEAIRAAAEALDYKTRPGAIVLVTDGKETCGGAPCQLAAELAADGFDLTVHVIGFKVRGSHFSWDGTNSGYNSETAVARCLADRTGGQYVSAESVSDLIAALRVTLGCPVFGALGPMSQATQPPPVTMISKP